MIDHCVFLFLFDSKEIDREQKTGNKNPGNNSNTYQVNRVKM